MFDKFISIAFENLSTVDDLMLTLKVLSFAFGNFLFRKPRQTATTTSVKIFGCDKMNLISCKPTSPFWMFLIKSSPPIKIAPISIAISQSRFSLENNIIVRYSLWSNACGIDTIFVKLSLNFVYFFPRKKSRKLIFCKVKFKNMDLNLKSQVVYQYPPRLNDLNKF